MAWPWRVGKGNYRGQDQSCGLDFSKQTRVQVWSCLHSGTTEARVYGGLECWTTVDCFKLAFG